MTRRISAVILLLSISSAQAALAQGHARTRLVPHKGAAVPFTVQLPEGWQVHERDGGMTATSEHALVGVYAADALGDEKSALPISEAESRRIVTSMILGSDSLLLAMMSQAKDGMTKSAGSPLSGTPEIRTLAGNRAAFLRTHMDAPPIGSVSVDMYFTVSDGYVVMLFYGAAEDSVAAWQPVFDRVRESLVLPRWSPPPAGSAPAARAAPARDTSDVFRWVEGRWNWARRKDPCGDSSFALSVAPDRQSIRLEYKRRPSEKDTALVYTYRVLGHAKDEIQGQIAGQTLPDGTSPIFWSFVRLGRDRFCWRRNDWAAPGCTAPLDRCVAPQALAPGASAGTLANVAAERRRFAATIASGR